VLKVISLIRRRDDQSLDDFRRWAFEQHAPKGRDLPGLREYRMNVVEADDGSLPYHAVSELWFDDEEASRAAFASDAGKAAGADIAANAGDRVRLFCREERIV
jgi:uncharacterized protein (TIGR02118 family)